MSDPFVVIMNNKISLNQTRMLKVWSGALLGRHQNVGGLGWRACRQTPKCWRFELDGCLEVTRMLEIWVGELMGRHQNVGNLGWRVDGQAPEC